MRARALAVVAVLSALLLPGAAAAGCDDFWIAPNTTTLNVPNENGGQEFALNAPSGCTYQLTVDSSGSWLEVNPGSITMSGTQAGFDVTWWVNELGYARSGRVRIEGPNDVQLIDVRQGATCEQTVSQATFYFDQDAHGGAFSVSTRDSCDWTVSTGDPWISAGGTQRGPQTVSFSIEANPLSDGRVGRINAGTASVIVSQAGVTGSSAPSAPPLGGSGSGGHDSGGGLMSDEDLAELPGAEGFPVLAALAVAAALALRRR